MTTQIKLVNLNSEQQVWLYHELQGILVGGSNYTVNELIIVAQLVKKLQGRGSAVTQEPIAIKGV